MEKSQTASLFPSVLGLARSKCERAVVCGETDTCTQQTGKEKEGHQKERRDGEAREDENNDMSHLPHVSQLTEIRCWIGFHVSFCKSYETTETQVRRR